MVQLFPLLALAGAAIAGPLAERAQTVKIMALGDSITGSPVRFIPSNSYSKPQPLIENRRDAGELSSGRNCKMRV